MMANRILLITSIALQVVISISIQPADHLLPPPQQYSRIPIPRTGPPSPESPGFMQRIARWFGFGKGPKDQQLDASYQYQQYKDPPHAYHYHPPKAPCNLCNKVPWIPMFPGNLQYPLVKSHSNQPLVPQTQFHQNTNVPLNQFVSLPTYSPPSNLPSPQYAPTFAFQPPLVQRAAKFNFPSYNGIANFNPDFSTSGSVFKNDQFVRPPQVAPIPVPNLSANLIPPLYGHIPFNKDSKILQQNVGPIHSEQAEASEVQSVAPTQLPPTLRKTQNDDSSFEIVQSVPVTDFVSSVEYPVNVIQSQVIDITSQPKPDTTESDFPKLIELGSYEPILPTPSPDYIPDPNIVHNHNSEPDNYPEASSHNLTYRHEQFEDIGNYISSTPSPFHPTETTTFQTEAPFQDILNINAQVEAARERIKFHPSFQTLPQNSEATLKRERQTPKRLLDSPILYGQGSSPRPFTRDPSDLRVRSSTYNHNVWQSQSTPTPWVSAPTPTSTYSSLDASGQFAGISPPSQFQHGPTITYPRPTEKSPKQLHQIIIPYTTKNKPRPFKAREELNDQPEDDVRYVNWSHSHEVEPHEQQESKLVTATEPPFKKTTKYLTKILATNIRELLKKEHDANSKSKSAFDFSKLQKNIDEWTQQEFSSLTHKASTASLRGRSKNIPSEYLTTTPSLKQTTWTVDSTEPPRSTTYSESFLDDEEVKKYDFLAKLVEDNHISSTENVHVSTEKVNITTTTDAAISPFYIRTVPSTPVHEPWEKLKVSISPLTKEKVYVVTPQPSLALEQQGATDSVGTFKSPRFLVRPTPGSGSIHVSSSTSDAVTSGYTPELFGLMGISAYMPTAPVETLDGHSKVITVITPASSKKRPPENNSSTSKEELASARGNSTSDITR